MIIKDDFVEKMKRDNENLGEKKTVLDRILPKIEEIANKYTYRIHTYFKPYRRLSGRRGIHVYLRISQTKIRIHDQYISIKTIDSEYYLAQEVAKYLSEELKLNVKIRRYK